MWLFKIPVIFVQQVTTLRGRQYGFEGGCVEELTLDSVHFEKKFDLEDGRKMFWSTLLSVSLC